MTTADQWAEVVRLWSESGRAGSPWRSGMRVYSSADVPGGRQYGRLVLDATHLVRDHSAAVAVWRLKIRPYHLPDPTDPATLGCLLGLVREVWGDPTLCAAPMGWRVSCPGQTIEAPTEAEALLAALIAGLER